MQRRVCPVPSPPNRAPAVVGSSSQTPVAGIGGEDEASVGRARWLSKLVLSVDDTNITREYMPQLYRKVTS
uniref:Uncharacterized protein n=1 Tax=Leersia perrieri TaxID=77586 RepID=A0A0D9WZZ2_9ORYZ